MYDLSGKVALVTGAGAPRGIGRAIALRLADEGADVVVNDLADTSGGGTALIERVALEVEAKGRRSMAMPGDVGDAAQVEEMIGKTLDRFDSVNILVNNAASGPGRDRVPVIDLDEEAWDLVQRVNVKGTFLCSRAVARNMVAQGNGGRIINMSSTRGKQGGARLAAYSASKAAVVGFTQSLALELAPHGITVNAVCPGMVDTERMLETAKVTRPAGVSAEEYHRQMLEGRALETPLGRVAQGGDVANLVAFLASSQADYMTGLAVNVAGGMQM